MARISGGSPALLWNSIHDTLALLYQTWIVYVNRVGSEDEAVAMANETRFGLAATMATGDPDRAERVSAQLSAGTVWVNCFFVRDLQAPFGGNGKSGIGREGGTWSFDFYCDVKNTVTAPKGWTTHG